MAAYFEPLGDYWLGKPTRPDPEGLFESNTDWRAWTFEVRFSEGQSLVHHIAWCGTQDVMDRLRRLQDEQDPAPLDAESTLLDRFLGASRPLVPRGAANFAEETEAWVRRTVGL